MSVILEGICDGCILYERETRACSPLDFQGHHGPAKIIPSRVSRDRVGQPYREHAAQLTFAADAARCSFGVNARIWCAGCAAEAQIRPMKAIVNTFQPGCRRASASRKVISCRK